MTFREWEVRKSDPYSLSTTILSKTDYADAYQNLEESYGSKVVKVPESLSAFSKQITLHNAQKQASAEPNASAKVRMGFQV
jgi:hypothetical protein